mmetsp:Transcript_11218/g.34586  ORF Transcript_11218/g.34586 Transcript_11218/m.34586 type:complete len:177 (+) Transcript_11218:18-548(+)
MRRRTAAAARDGEAARSRADDPRTRSRRRRDASPDDPPGTSPTQRRPQRPQSPPGAILGPALGSPTSVLRKDRMPRIYLLTALAAAAEQRCGRRAADLLPKGVEVPSRVRSPPPPAATDPVDYRWLNGTRFTSRVGYQLLPSARGGRAERRGPWFSRRWDAGAVLLEDRGGAAAAT